MQETQEMRVQSLDREDPLEEEMATSSVLSLGKSHAQRSLMGYCPQGCEEFDMSEHSHTPCF